LWACWPWCSEHRPVPKLTPSHADPILLRSHFLDDRSERERTIEDALSEAKKAREEIAAMTSRNEQLDRAAREEREVLLKEARDIREKEIAEAKEKAKVEVAAMLERARAEIRNEKSAAVADIKMLVGELSVEIAEKLLREKLTDDAAQRALVDRMLKEAEARLS
jgi:F-type H+-transporting ATPase subunit b